MQLSPEFEKVFAAAGMLPREAQLVALEAIGEWMTREVERPRFVFNFDAVADRLGIVAGTGSGKSPISFCAAYLAWTRGYQTIIATASKSLAIQYEATMSEIAPNLPGPRFAYLAGLENYACPRTWDNETVPVSITSRDTMFRKSMLLPSEVRAHSFKGVQFDLPEDENEPSFPCIPPSMKNPHGCHLRSYCSAHRERENAAQADIIVTNHVAAAWVLDGRFSWWEKRKTLLIADEADRAEESMDLDPWGRFDKAPLKQVLSGAGKSLFMSATLGERHKAKFGLTEPLLHLPLMDRTKAPVLWNNRAESGLDAVLSRIGAMRQRLGSAPGMIVCANRFVRQRILAAPALADAKVRLYDMAQAREGIKAQHIADPENSVIVGFHAGAGIGLDLPGDQLAWLIVVGVPQDDDEDKVADLVVQSVGRGCRFGGDSCVIEWLPLGAPPELQAEILKRLIGDGHTLHAATDASGLAAWRENLDAQVERRS